MKRVLFIGLVLVLGSTARAQLTGGTLLPTGKYQGFNKSAIATGKKLLDGKMSYYDTINFVSRPFLSITEANAFLPVNQRAYTQVVLINSGGTLNTTGGNVTYNGIVYTPGEIIGGVNSDFWYRNSTANGGLVAKTLSAGEGIVIDSVYGTITSTASGSTYTAGQGVNISGGAISTNYPVVNSVAAMRAITSPTANSIYRLSVGGSIADFLYNASNTTAIDDSVIYIRKSGGGGTFERQYGDLDPFDWGVVPNTGADMTSAMQRLAVFAMTNGRTQHIRFTRGGVYIINNLVLAVFSGGQAQQATVTIEGTNASNSQAVYFRTTTVSAATILIQTAQNIVLKNLVLQGPGPTVTDDFAATDATWTAGGIRNNHLTPNCGVSIDELFTGSGTTFSGSTDYRPGLSSYMTNTTYTGSTGVTMDNVIFTNFYANIAVGLSGCPSAENISWQNSPGASHDSKYAWIGGQLQSRTNSMTNVHFFGGHTFMTNVGFGTGLGDVPKVFNSNINGVKQLYQVSGGFTDVSFSNCYFENIGSFGAAGNDKPVNFSNCKTTFESTTNTHYIPLVVAEGGGAFNYEGGYILSYQNRALPFNHPQVNFYGGVTITAGLPFITNPNNFDKVMFNGATYAPYGAALVNNLQEGSKFTIGNEYEINGKALLPGMSALLNTTRTYTNVGGKFDKIATEAVTVTVNAGAKTATFTSTNAGRYAVGDNIWADESITDAGNIYSATASSIGYVSGIAGNVVSLAYIPAMTTGTKTLSIVRMPNFIQHTTGDVTSGSDTIRNMLMEDFTFPIGSVIKGAGIPNGARVLNIIGNKIKMSLPASATATTVPLYDAKIRTTATNEPFQYFGTYQVEDLDFIWFPGDRIDYVTNGSTIAGKVVLTAGKHGTATPPTFLTIGTSGTESDPVATNASNISSGTLAFARLPTNLARLDVGNSLTGAQLMNVATSNAIQIDYNGTNPRIFSGQTISYQSNKPGGGYEHDFNNEFGSSFTGDVMHIGTAASTLGSGQKILTVTGNAGAGVANFFANGLAQFPLLAGIGTRMVTTDASGYLGVAAIPDLLPTNNAWTGTNSFGGANGFPVTLNSTTTYSYLALDNTTASPNVGIQYRYNGSPKWSTYANLGVYSFYNNTTSSNALTLDTLNNAATFSGPVTITTASTGDSSNKAASTAWVKRQLFGTGGGGSGSVTSVGLSLPSIFSVSGSPVTTTGTLTGALATQTANTIFAGPTTGSSAAPTFRSIVSADIPSSVALAGSPTTTTATALDSSGKIATTAYVDRATSKGATTYKSYGGGADVLRSITTSGDTSKIGLRTMGTLKGMTVLYQGDTLIQFSAAYNNGYGTPTNGTVTGAGTGATVSFTEASAQSTDASGIISVTTGSSGTLSTIGLTINFSASYAGYIPKIILTGIGAASDAIHPYVATSAFSGFSFATTGTAAYSTTYRFQYVIVP